MNRKAMVKLRKIKDTMESSLIFSCSVFLTCLSLLTFFNLRVQTYQLSEMNDNVEMRLKCGCFYSAAYGKNISILYCFKRHHLDLAEIFFFMYLHYNLTARVIF